MKYITSMIAVTLLGLILVTTAVLVFAARNSGSRLRKKFDHIGPSLASLIKSSPIMLDLLTK